MTHSVEYMYLVLYLAFIAKFILGFVLQYFNECCSKGSLDVNF